MQPIQLKILWIKSIEWICRISVYCDANGNKNLKLNKKMPSCAKSLEGPMDKAREKRGVAKKHHRQKVIEIQHLSSKLYIT